MKDLSAEISLSLLFILVIYQVFFLFVRSLLFGDLFIYFYLKMEFQREERQSEVLHQLVHFQNGHDAWNWVSWTPGARLFLWISYVGIEAQGHRQFAASSHQQGSGKVLACNTMARAPSLHYLNKQNDSENFVLPV